MVMVSSSLRCLAYIKIINSDQNDQQHCEAKWYDRKQHPCLLERGSRNYFHLPSSSPSLVSRFFPSLTSLQERYIVFPSRCISFLFSPFIFFSFLSPSFPHSPFRSTWSSQCTRQCYEYKNFVYEKKKTTVYGLPLDPNSSTVSVRTSVHHSRCFFPQRSFRVFFNYRYQPPPPFLFPAVLPQTI